MKTRLFLLLAFIFPFCFTANGQSDSTAAVVDTLEEAPAFLSPNFDILKTLVNDPHSEFYYPKLLKRFIAADTSLTIEELHCIYYGSALQDNYSPYGPDGKDYADKALEILNLDNPSKRQLKKALKYLNKAIDNDPMNIKLYGYRHFLEVQLHGQESAKAAADAFRFVALISVIHYSGDGKDYPTAFYVISPSHEYVFLGYNRLSSQGQSLRYNRGEAFDVLTIADNEYGIDTLYFNIDVCFNFLSKLFGDLEGVDTDLEDMELAELSFDDDEEGSAHYAMLDTTGRLIIPMGNRVVIHLDTVLEDGQYNFTIVTDEIADSTYDFTNSMEYFPEEGEENTIVFYFVPSQWSSGKKCEVLMMKSFCKEMLSYDTEIIHAGDHSFQTTSNNGIFPKVCGTEIWNESTLAIRLSRFRPMK